MWVRASKAIPAGSHVRLGDSVLDTSIEGAVATAEVPISLLRYGGSLPISLVAPDGTPRSNSLSLQVIDRTAGLLEITAFGPTSIEVGQPFNVQPNGASAMWVRAAKGIPVGSHIRLGDSVLDTSIEGAVATAEVPASLIQRAGDLSISLAGPNGDQLSNAVVFHLSERNSPPPQ